MGYTKKHWALQEDGLPTEGRLYLRTFADASLVCVDVCTDDVREDVIYPLTLTPAEAEGFAHWLTRAAASAGSQLPPNEKLDALDLAAQIDREQRARVVGEWGPAATRGAIEALVGEARHAIQEAGKISEVARRRWPDEGFKSGDEIDEEFFPGEPAF